MIIGFIGGRNSGKTCSMTIEAYKKYRQGYKIYSNYHLNFPYTPYTIDDLLAFAEAGMYFGNTIFLIDEIHIYFDARSSGQKRNKIFSYFLNQSSKNDIDVYYTSQFARQVEIRLRLNTEIVVESVCKSFVWTHKNSKPIMLENYRPKPKDYRTKTYITNRIIKFSDTGQDKISERVYYANKYFKLYDTHEVIRQQKDVFQRAKDDSPENDGVSLPVKKSYAEKREEQHQNRLFHDANRKRVLGL